jgi:hypothetical protein
MASMDVRSCCGLGRPRLQPKWIEITDLYSCTIIHARIPKKKAMSGSKGLKSRRINQLRIRGSFYAVAVAALLVLNCCIQESETYSLQSSRRKTHYIVNEFRRTARSGRPFPSSGSAARILHRLTSNTAIRPRPRKRRPTKRSRAMGKTLNWMMESSFLERKMAKKKDHRQLHCSSESRSGAWRAWLRCRWCGERTCPRSGSSTRTTSRDSSFRPAITACRPSRRWQSSRSTVSAPIRRSRMKRTSSSRVILAFPQTSAARTTTAIPWRWRCEGGSSWECTRSLPAPFRSWASKRSRPTGPAF